MTKSALISAFSHLGQLFSHMAHNESYSQYQTLSSEISDEEIHSKLKAAEIKNPWFTPDNLKFSLIHWSNLLTPDNLTAWTKDISFKTEPKNIGIVADDQIPFDGLHDLLAVLLSGNRALVKTSVKNEVLLDFIIDFLKKVEPGLEDRIQKSERLTGYDAVIASGKDETLKYFEYYFRDYPHLIRKNKTSVAVLSGDENEEDLKKLAEDVFVYFGLNSRNASKIYLPEGFNTDLIFEAIYDWNPIVNHHKYANNYDYNRAVYLMEQIPFLDNNFVILKEDKGIKSPPGVVFLEFYEDLNKVKESLNANREKLECIIGKDFEIPLGQANKPGLGDYVNEKNTLEFLKRI